MSSCDTTAMPTRSFKRSDLDQVMEIERAAFDRTAFSRRAFRRFHRDARSLFLVMEEDAEILGYLICSLCTAPCTSLYVASVAVREGRRRGGVATGLVERGIGAARRAGASMAWLHVRVSNRGAISFYANLGFEIAREIPGYYRDEDAYIMMRALALEPDRFSLFHEDHDHSA